MTEQVLLDADYIDSLANEEPLCPKCGSYMEWANCWNGCDDGYFDMWEEDPLWYDPGDTETCDVCRGHGGWWVCDVCVAVA